MAIRQVFSHLSHMSMNQQTQGLTEPESAGGTGSAAPGRHLRIALLAGEPSGDTLGANLTEEILRLRPDAEIFGITGPLMEKAGCERVRSIDELSVMGFAEVLRKLPTILSLRKFITSYVTLDRRPDVLVGIDAPDFNLYVEEKAHAAGIKTVHYVSPSVWAWRQKRVFRMKRSLDLVLCFLPFEKEFYDRFSLSSEFIGHTLADEIPLENPLAPSREALGLPQSGRVFALLPGSRSAEVGYLTPVLLDAACRLKKKYPDAEFAVPLVSEKRKSQFLGILESHPGKDLLGKSLHLYDRRARECMQAADLVILSSGTATLECMLVGRPMVIIYKVSPLTELILHMILKTRTYGLPNLLHGEKIVPELVQRECTGENAAAEAERILEGGGRDALLGEFRRMHELLRKNAGRKAAESIIRLAEGA